MHSSPEPLSAVSFSSSAFWTACVVGKKNISEDNQEAIYSSDF